MVIFESPKPKRTKPYSPPPREGPSATRQAARKRKLEYSTDDASMKLPDLVTNSSNLELFNGGTSANALHKNAGKQKPVEEAQPPQEVSLKNNDVQSNTEPNQVLPQAVDPSTSRNTALLTVANNTPTQTLIEPLKEPIGHDTCTTTDEEEAIEALLPLGDLPDNNIHHDELTENKNLMPIGIPNPGTDVNPVEIKLGTDHVTQAIANLPDENRFRPPTPPHHADNTGRTDARPNKNTNTNLKDTETDVPSVSIVPQLRKSASTTNTFNSKPSRPASSNTTSQQAENPPKASKSPNTADNTADDTPPEPVSPNKGILKVTKYGLQKGHHKKRTYKCQNCGKRENSVHDLNKHHRQSHPPLLCSDCNKIFYITSTFQLHLYEHQKQKIPCETCGQRFSFQGQLDQHKIVHRTIKTHKCMAKDCDRWFMRKADLKVHVATHDKTVYTCEHCETFKTHLKKYWKEHIKGHNDILPYACSICKEWFLY